MELNYARLLHVIRDPCDVPLSAMRYHRVTPLGNEKFLREKCNEWGEETTKIT